MLQLGLLLPVKDPQLDAPALVELARRAESAGFDAVFAPEATTYEATSLLGAVAVATARVRIGTAVIPVPLRSPALTAMGAASLASLSGGRFVLGLGSGHRDLVEGWHGLPFAAGADVLRAHVEAVRRELEGRAEVPIHLGALAPSSLRAAGQVADGVLLTYVPPGYLDQVLSYVREAGRRPEIVLIVPVQISDDVTAGREAARAELAAYFDKRFYRRMFAAAGFDEPSDDLLDSVYLVGGVESCARRLAEYGDHGVDTVLVYPQGRYGDRESALAGHTRALTISSSSMARMR